MTHELVSATLPVWSIIPFAGMLLSIAIVPLVRPEWWEKHMLGAAFAWSLLFLIPFAAAYGVGESWFRLLESVLLDYIPFIVLLFGLFVVAGGIAVCGTLAGTTKINCLLLFIGTFLASWIGTTGAAMLLIRPIIRANAWRKNKVHLMVFFIFLVANMGGCLTPLGDPPLFLGFLKGVSFFWTTVHLFCKTVLLSVILLGIFFLLDTFLFSKEGKPKPATQSNEKLGLDGKVNLLLLIGVVISVLMSGIWKPESGFEIYGTHIELQNAARDVILLALAGASLALTTKECRKLNNFTWEPILEVAKLFIGIFISMIPAIAILRAGTDGALAGVINMVFHEGQPVNAMFFWLTGILSSFLDNAPTYLVFFNTAGGDAVHLMTDWTETLSAISAGAVFMGAVTYIGNAPNFMVRSIAEDQGVKMPSFFGYMLWSVGILFPCFALITYLFFM